MRERLVEDVTVLAITGRMAVDDGYGMVRQRIREGVEQGRRKFVLNLAQVSYLDSTCLGDLIAAVVTVRKSGGTMHLTNLTDRVERLMRIAHLDQVFGMFPTEQEAVQRLVSGPGDA